MITNALNYNGGTIELLYPTPIYAATVRNIPAMQSDIDKAVSGNSLDAAPSTWGRSVNVTDINADIISNMSLSVVENEVHYHLENYCNFLQFGMRKYKRNSWLAKTGSGESTHVHTHSYFDIAGVYYYKTNGLDGNLFFLPDSPIGAGFCYQKFADRWDHQPRVGKIVLFPAWMLHGVKQNETNSERIALAFSVAFER